MEHPHPRPPSSQERALSDPVRSRLGQVICHARGHDPAVSCGRAIAREAQKLQPDSWRPKTKRAPLTASLQLC